MKCIIKILLITITLIIGIQYSLSGQIPGIYYGTFGMMGGRLIIQKDGSYSYRYCNWETGNGRLWYGKCYASHDTLILEHSSYRVTEGVGFTRIHVKRKRYYQKEVEYWVINGKNLCLRRHDSGENCLIRNKPSAIHADIQFEMERLVDSLAGDWELDMIICKNGKDTLKRGCFITRGEDAYQRTTLHMDTFQFYELIHSCNKCRVNQYSGYYVIEIGALDGIGFYYLNLDNKKRNVRRKSTSLSKAYFSGHITNFTNNTFQLTDMQGCDWIYRRKTKL